MAKLGFWYETPSFEGCGLVRKFIVGKEWIWS